MVEIATVPAQENNNENIKNEFHLQELVQELLKTDCTSIALQFPDPLLDRAPDVTIELDLMLQEQGGD